MLNALGLLHKIAKHKEPFSFINDERRQPARDAVTHGIDCLLKAQIVIDGNPTIWCAQHDPLTLAPSGARMQEPASLNSYESVSVIRFLKKGKRPTTASAPLFKPPASGIVNMLSLESSAIRRAPPTRDFGGYASMIWKHRGQFSGCPVRRYSSHFQEPRCPQPDRLSIQYYCDRPREVVREN